MADRYINEQNERLRKSWERYQDTVRKLAVKPSDLKAIESHKNRSRRTRNGNKRAWIWKRDCGDRAQDELNWCFQRSWHCHPKRTNVILNVPMATTLKTYQCHLKMSQGQCHSKCPNDIQCVLINYNTNASSFHFSTFCHAVASPLLTCYPHFSLRPLASSPALSEFHLKHARSKSFHLGHTMRRRFPGIL